MNILVAGCGTVGAMLANKLSADGHDVCMVEADQNRLTRLSDDFSGYTVVGIPIDQDVLREAGIEDCDALAAVTSDDNTNIMICQMASEIFKVPRVIARIHEPLRGDAFSQFSVRIICPTIITTDVFYSALVQNQAPLILHIGSATIALERVVPSPKQVGLRVEELCRGNGDRQGFYGIQHDDGSISLAFATSGETIQQGDWLLYTRVID